MEFPEVKPLSRLIAAACALALSSCATGFDRGELRTKLFAATGRTTDADIAKVLALKSQVRRPFSMGVCTDFVATSADRELFASKIAELQTAGIVGKVVFISEVSSSEAAESSDATATKGKASQLKQVRLAAARRGLDTVLTLHTASDTRDHDNALAVLNLTIVGGYIAPSSHHDTLVLMSGMLWDVRNEYLYVTAEAEGLEKQIRPSFLTNEDKGRIRANTKALTAFCDEFVKRAKTLK